MSGSGIDEDTLIALGCGLVAFVCLYLAVRGFRRGSVLLGLVWLAGAAAFGFVAWFFVTFTMRMF